MRILSCYVWLQSVMFHLSCVLDPLSLNGLPLPQWHKNAPLWEFLGRKVLVLALDLLEICWACSVYWVTGPAGLCNRKLIYTPVSDHKYQKRIVTVIVVNGTTTFLFYSVSGKRTVHVLFDPRPFQGIHCGRPNCLPWFEIWDTANSKVIPQSIPFIPGRDTWN